MRSAPQQAKAAFDPRLERAHQALGTHRALSCVQGGQAKAELEIHIVAVFKEAPGDCLRMIAAHELASQKERDR